jgi:hypothetical protein
MQGRYVNASHRKLSHFRYAAGARQIVDATVCGFPSWRKVSAQCVLHVGQRLRSHIDAFMETYHQRANLLVRTKAEMYQRRIKGCGISQLFSPHTSVARQSKH